MLVTNLVVLSQPFVVHGVGSKDVGRSICMKDQVAFIPEKLFAV